MAWLPFTRSPSPDLYDSSILYFFISFLTMNNLSSDRLPVASDLLDLMHEAPALRNAISAVAVQHRIQQTSPLKSADKFEALQSYSQSVSYINSLIASDSFVQDPSALWTTFVLGLFEVKSNNIFRTFIGL